MNPLPISLLSESLVDAGLKATLLLGVAWLVALGLKGSSARVRQVLWAAVLGGATLLPVLTWMLPSWQVPLLERPAVSHQAIAMGRLDQPLSAGAGLHGEGPGQNSDRHGLALSATERGSRSTAALRPGSILLGLWALGALGAAAWLMVGLIRVWWLTRGGRRLSSPGWENLSGALAGQLGLARGVELVESEQIHAPMTWGHRRPTVLMPAGMDPLKEESRLLLLHELVHVRRGDWLLQLVAQLSCLIYWFHPLAWWATGRLALERELACDEEVLARGTQPSRYASCLLQAARRMRQHTFLPCTALGMARRSSLEGRLMAILDKTKNTGRRAWMLVPMLLLASVLIPVLAAVHPWAPSVADEQKVAEAKENPAVAEACRKLREHEKQAHKFHEQLAPHEQELRRVMEPLEKHLHEKFAAREHELQAIAEKIHAHHEKLAHGLEPLHRRMAELHRKAEREAEASGEVAETTQAEMEVLEQELEAAHARLEDREMDRLHAEMEAVHAEIEREMEGTEHIHQEAEEIHQRMERALEEMEPLHEEMELAHQDLERAIFADMLEMARRAFSDRGHDLSPALASALEESIASFPRQWHFNQEKEVLEIDAAPRRIRRSLERGLGTVLDQPGQLEALNDVIEDLSTAYSEMSYRY